MRQRGDAVAFGAVAYRSAAFLWGAAAALGAGMSVAQPLPDVAFPQQRAVAARPAAPPSSDAGASPSGRPAPPEGATLVASGPGGKAAAVVGDGLREWRDGAWQTERLRNDREGWDPRTITAIAFDTRGRLWVASSQGLGVHEPEGWRFIDPARGLPVLDITSMAAAPDGAMWIGTRRGAVRIAPDGAIEYRQGRRWLPHDDIRARDRRRERHGLVRHGWRTGRHRGSARRRSPPRPRRSRTPSIAIIVERRTGTSWRRT